MKAVPDEECRRLGSHGAASGVRDPDAGEKQRMSRRMGCRCLVSPGTEAALDVERHRQTVLSLQTSSAVGGAQWDQPVFHFGLWLRFSPAQLVHVVFLSQHSPRSHL